ncbi:MAG: prepilin-type N-terminal cleavage/methylation domain-containing protein [Candidatus Omnitrophica bacterium]|nr:prepilin-type N-terminal cleavage/methylation domain-containing protein [Candidatus Omnitrophota bacterium]
MRRAFSLFELVVVIIIIGIGIAMFYSTLLTNWAAYEKRVSDIDLQMEGDRIVEFISNDAKSAREIRVTPDGKQVTLCYSSDCATATIFRITGADRVERSTDGGATYTEISRYLNTNRSIFSMVGNRLNRLEVNLLLRDIVFGETVNLTVTTQIFPRNLQ